MNPSPTLRLINLAHALDHFILLVYPTAVIAIARETALDYGDLVTLSTGAFVAFGVFALPAGWLADRYGRRALMAAFFLGSGVSCLAIALAQGATSLAITLFVMGVFSAIYHPVGTAMLVSSATRLGRDLGVNAVWGNLGAAFAAGITGAIATWSSWRMAFVAPGLVLIAAGIAWLRLVPREGAEGGGIRRVPAATLPRSLLLAFIATFLLVACAGGMVFNVVTIALPKVIDERLGLALPLVVTGSLATAVFVLGAATQLTIGRLVDRVSAPLLFAGLGILQPLGLAIAAATTGWAMLAGIVIAMSSIYGQVVVNDAMLARYTTDAFRARLYGLRYCLSFAAAGFAVPLIGALHDKGGFPRVLGVAAGFAAVVALGAVAMLVLTKREQPGAALAPAE